MSEKDVLTVVLSTVVVAPVSVSPTFDQSPFRSKGYCPKALKLESSFLIFRVSVKVVPQIKSTGIAEVQVGSVRPRA